MVKLSSSLTKQFGRKDLLAPHINNWFARGTFPDEIVVSIHMNKENDDAFHPSSALDCARVLFAKRAGEFPRAENTLEAQKTFAYGHFIHGLMYQIVQELGFTKPEDIEKEFDFYDETPQGNPYRVRGFVDIARCDIPGQKTPVLVDIKSQMAIRFAKAETDVDLLEKYSAQVQLYLEFVGLDTGIIFWAEKDQPHRFKETIIKHDPDLIDRIVTNWEYVVDAEVAGEIPDCTCDSDKLCPARSLYV